MKDQATLDVLDFYTKQLSNVDYFSEDHNSIKKKKTYEQLASEIMKFNKQKDKYSNIMSNFRTNMNINKSKNSFNKISKFLSLIIKLNKIKTKMNVKFSSSLINDLTTSLTFDYIVLYMTHII